jgi:signal transduction histidine kinase
MGAFSYSIAHDLRGPLRAMSGFAQALTEDYAQVLGDAGKEYAERISSAALRMQKMIDDLLDYSRLTRAEMPCHPLDPGGVVDLVLATLFPEIEALEADVTVERPFPIVLAHEVTLGQVLQNLVANALKFVPENVTPRIRIRSEARDGHIRLWIEDNGIGIAPQYQDRIFGVFERLDSSGRYPGTGIGLAIVKRAVERMKGKVGVDSSLGGGSRFWVDLRKPAPP